MRKIHLIVIVLIIFQFGFAQNKALLYNFTSIPQASLVNPGADVSYKYYFGVPLLSGVSVNLGSNSFSPYDLLANNGVDFTDKVRKIINKSSANDKSYVNQQLELLSGGFRVGGEGSQSFISFGIYQEFDFFMYMPKDLAILALDGNRDYMGKTFNLGDLSVKAEALSVFHIGFHKKVSEKLVLGGRAKIYSSGANATSTKNSGFVYTNEIAGTPNIYDQIISSNLELKTSGIDTFTKDEYRGSETEDILHNSFFNGSFGLGIDAGFTYYFKENLQFTASVIDLGFVRQSKDIKTLTFKGNYNYEGVNPDFDNIDGPRNVLGDFEKAVPKNTLYNKYTTWRPTKFYSSLQYSFGESRYGEDCSCRTPSKRGHANSIGGQLFIMSVPKKPFVAFTAFYKRSILDKLDFKATYTLDTFSSTNIGLGLSGTIGKINIYGLVDNVFEYKDFTKANSIGFQFGINFIVPESD